MSFAAPDVNASSGSAPVRVAHAIHSGGFYGAEKVVVDLMHTQAARPGFEVWLLAFLDPGQSSNDLADRVASAGFRVVRFHTAPGVTLSGIREYARILRSAGFRLVHSHGYKVTVFHLLSRWLGMQGAPLLVTAHGYALRTGNWKAALYRWLDILFLGSVEGVVAVSNELGAYLRTRNPRCRIRTIPNGIQADFQVKGTRPLRRLLAGAPGAPGSAPVIGSVGRLDPVKNQALLIRAYAELRRSKPCRLVIIGEGPLKQSLQDLWRDLIPDETPLVLPYQTDVCEWIADMDVFSLPSNTEGLPITLLEAGALERAVACSSVGGIPEVVRDRENGRLFRPGDLGALTAALSDLIGNPGDRLAYGRALRAEVLRNYEIRRTGERYMEAYAHVLTRN